MYSIFKTWINRYLADEEAVLLVLLLIAAVAILVTVGNILAPMIAAVVIAFLMQGMVERLKSWNVPHLASVIISTLVFVGVLATTTLVLFPLIWQQLIRLISEVPRMVAEGRSVLLLLPKEYPALVTEQQVQQIIDLTNQRMGEFGEWLLSLSVTKLPLILTILVYLVLVPILVFFFLKDGRRIVDTLATFLPNERPVMTKIWVEMNIQIANYVRGKVIEILVVASVSYAAFILLGLNYALLLGIAVGLSVVIPYIGAAAVTLPVAMIAYFQWGWSSEFMTVLIVYIIIQMLDGNVLVPWLFSETVNLHPVAIILAILLFGGIWGFWGIFFAIPLATLIKAIFNAWPTRHEVFVEEGGGQPVEQNNATADDDSDSKVKVEM